MKRTVFAIVIFLVALLSIPVTFIIIGFATPSQYALTYYGELGKMYENLRLTSGRKIVIIGTSNVAFGVDSALMSEELSAAGADYEVVNFGLYGALGTKVMLDLSEQYIGEGDIVVFAPELNAQAMSTYFSATDMWYAADCDFSLLGGIAEENAAEMVGNFAGYVSSKFGCLTAGSPAQPSGVYASASFDENCDMKNAERPHNIMPGGVDSNSLIYFDETVISDDFVDYVNDYCASVSEKGATMLYSFAPMNEAAFSGYYEPEIEAYYEFVSENFDFNIISDPYDYVMEREWFYDSNFHLNASGMTVRTVRLLGDLKNWLGIRTPTDAELPEMPDLPEHEYDDTEGNNDFAEFFVYEDGADGMRITGIAGGVTLPSEITVPYSYGGRTITSFDADVFAGNGEIEEIVIQDNIVSLQNGSFDGCTSLKRIILLQADPSAIGVGQGLLTGADNCRIYVPADSYSAYAGNYFWSNYAGRLEIYE